MNRWWLLAGLWLLYISFGLTATCIAPLVILIEKELGITHAAMGSVMGVWQLLGFTMFLGALLGPLLQRVLGLPNGVSLVMMAAGGTAVIFALMAGIATTTKRDLSTGLGGFLAVGSIVLILAVIANAFVQSPVMYRVLLAGFVLISTLMMLWQINTIVRGGETNYVSATLTLYISIYNLFSSLLQLLGIGGSD